VGPVTADILPRPASDASEKRGAAAVLRGIQDGLAGAEAARVGLEGVVRRVGASERGVQPRRPPSLTTCRARSVKAAAVCCSGWFGFVE